MAKAAKDYYLRKLGEISPREDYYLRGGTATGLWRGNGATDLGLEGAVTAEGLVRLFDGQHPGTGEQLGRSRTTGLGTRTQRRVRLTSSGPHSSQPTFRIRSPTTADPLLVLLVEPTGRPPGRLLNSIARQHRCMDHERHLAAIAAPALTDDAGTMRSWCERLDDIAIASAQRDPVDIEAVWLYQILTLSRTL